MPVAKTYQNWILVCEPYEKNKRMYVRAQSPKGAEKEVRWYTESEYARMYPDTVKQASTWDGKKALGFTNGYITIFKGDLESAEEWFLMSNCRYHTSFGWYVVSTEEIQNDMPQCITPVRLPWELVSDHLENKTALAAIVNELLYGKSKSQWIGNIGDRLALELTCISRSEQDRGPCGIYYYHTFVDENENQYIWLTGAKKLEVAQTYSLRGTVKEFITKDNIKQTVLTRCFMN